MNDKKLLGRWGEERAAEYLQEKRYRIVAKNFSCRFGEIDLIAENRAYVAFVEVKLRKNAVFAQAREFVTASKQQKLIATAQFWLTRHPTDKQPRFDVIEIYAPHGAAGDIQINHIENAFGLY